MPTTRLRHTITETDDVKEALDDLRAVVGGARIDFAELVKLGARAKADSMSGDTPAKRRARGRLAQQIRSGTFDPGTDLDAAIEVRRPRIVPPPLDAPLG